ncbi:hypothetical protein FPV67DRAFT_13239 [Lyophyllum atratum]|nr:hypothetical protein FPV67DRAFT_13239 [Lyophyllum atratum]
MSEWTGAKTEDSSSPFVPSAMTGAESSVYPTAAEPRTGPSQGVLPETEHLFRPPTATPSERQRTVQACDKCRERKTKCSGEHPACQRCTTRGLICQYSSREPRTRGPAKARLRNAISSADLRSPSNLPNYSHGPQSVEAEQPPHQSRHFPSQHYQALQDYPILRRVASIPRSPHADSELHSVPMNAYGFEAAHDNYMQPFRYEDSSYDAPFHAPPAHYTPGNLQISHLRDVRRVQSHSTLIGSSGGGLSRSTQYGHPSPQPFDDFTGSYSYGQWPLQGQISPRPVGMFDTFEHQVPLAAPLEPQVTHHHSSKVHSWGYHSDGGSTGSEPMHGSEPNIGYSPSSSEDAPEVSSHRTSGLGVVTTSHDPRTFTQANNFPSYTHYDYGAEGNPRSLPSVNGCAPPFNANTTSVRDGHYNQQGLASDTHIHYQVVGP